MSTDTLETLRAERDALRAECERLRAFVASLRADGLDIDDPTTAPVWTGKIHVDGRLVFDLATVAAPEPIPYSALCHHQDRPHCAGCPDDAVCEASGRAPRKHVCTWCGLPIVGVRVEVRRDAAGQTHKLHLACVGQQADWESGR